MVKNLKKKSSTSSQITSAEDIPTTEEFLALCYKCKLSADDMEFMMYGDCMDYINSWIDMHDTEKPKKARKATQADIDRLW